MPETIKRNLYAGKLDATARIRIVQAVVNSQVNSLDNRLTAHLLEPGESSQAKLDLLRSLHDRDTKAQAVYESAMKAYRRGQVPRPRKPQADFMVKLQGEVKQAMRTQANRAETRAFENAGHTIFHG